MAEFRWQFELKKKYILKVHRRIAGNAEVFLNRKKMFEDDSRTFSYYFLLDGVSCTIRFEMDQASVLGPLHPTMDLWAPQLYLDDKKVKPS